MRTTIFTIEILQQTWQTRLNNFLKLQTYVKAMLLPQKYDVLMCATIYKRYFLAIYTQNTSYRDFITIVFLSMTEVLLAVFCSPKIISSLNNSISSLSNLCYI